MEWFQNSSVMISIFKLINFPVSELQGNESMNQVIRIFYEFLIDIIQCEYDLELSINSIREILEKIVWYPDYGCCRFCFPDFEGELQTNLKYYILALDGWLFDMQQSNYIANSFPQNNNYVMLYGGCISLDKEQEFEKVFQKQFNESIKKYGNDRRADSDSRGHQKTATFIHGIVHDTIDLVANGKATISQPRGGFTDVGLHTGGFKRDTCFSLLEAAVSLSVSMLLRDSSVPFELITKQLFTVFFLWLLKGQMKLFTESDNLNGSDINIIMQMLTKTVESGASIFSYCQEYKNSGMTYGDRFISNMNCFKNDCSQIRLMIEDTVKEADRIESSNFLLRVKDILDLWDANIVYLNIRIVSKCKIDSDQSSNHNEIRKKSMLNMTCLPVLSLASSSCVDAINWVNSCLSLQSQYNERSGITESLILNSLEQLVFSIYSESLLSNKVIESNSSSSATVVNIEQIVMMYRETLQRFKSSSNSNSLMKVELKSKEVLLVWVSFCMIHKITKKEHPIVGKYSVPLHYKDLQNLVLSDKVAIDCLQKVGLYLMKETITNSPEIFSLRFGCENATFLMARTFAETDRRMSSILKGEVESADKRQEEKWQQILKQQKEARELRIVIRNLEHEKQVISSELAACNTEDDNLFREKMREHNLIDIATRRYHRAPTRTKRIATVMKENELSQVNHKILVNNQQLKIAETPPPPIYFALPYDKKLALTSIFFFHMTPHFDSLSRMSFMAQQMLMIDHNIDCRISSAVKHSLGSHYRQFRLSKENRFRSEDGDVKLFSDQAIKATFPSHIDQYKTSFDAVWYPDSLRPYMVWNGGKVSVDNIYSGQFFDPFVENKISKVSEYYTEKLSSGFEKFQWCLVLDDNNKDHRSTRGNMSIALQNSKPQFFSNREFINFTSLRAYPLSQFRSLYKVLHDRSVPLNNVMVRVLIKQLMYQLGPLKSRKINISEGNLYFEWRVELQETNLLDHLLVEFNKLLDDLCETPVNHESFYLLAIMVSYFSQFHSSTREIARRMVISIERWCSDIENRILVSTSPIFKINMKSEQCLYYLYGIVIHQSGDLNQRDCFEMIKFNALACNIALFEDKSKFDSQIVNLKIVCRDIMASRLKSLLVFCTANTNMLTETFRLVLHNTPCNLNWSNITLNNMPSSCFEAVTSDHTYCINILTGDTLLDGFPPSRLPKEILNNNIYKRSFGNSNFDTFRINSNSFQTLHPINNYNYTFSILSNGSLGIYEDILFLGYPIRLRLLDGYQSNNWVDNLPIRLRELYSHWYWEEKDLIILRQINFSTRNADYIIANCSSNFPVIYCIPKTLSIDEKYFIKFEESSDLIKLIILSVEHPIMRILSKFENSCFIHVFKLPNGSIKIELPRYSLSFIINCGIDFCNNNTIGVNDIKIMSNNFDGYSLSSCQQFSDGTLRGFNKYLLLSNYHAQEKVIIPDGKIISDSDNGKISISVSNSSSSSLKFYEINVHSRFKYLRPTSIVARLQLAALYTATNLLLVPSYSRISMTGDEYAMELVRECYSNKPLDIASNEYLNSIKEFNKANNALNLLCDDLFNNSNEMSFLFSDYCNTLNSIPPDENSMTGYLNQRTWRRGHTSYQSLNCRKYLSDTEFHKIFNLKKQFHIIDLQMSSDTLDTTVLDSSLYDSKFVSCLQLKLKSFLKDENISEESKRSSIFDDISIFDSNFGKEFICSLKISWDKFLNLNNQILSDSVDKSYLGAFLSIMMSIVTEKQQLILSDIFHDINNIPFLPGQCFQMSSLNLLQLTYLTPKVSKRDLLRLVLNRLNITDFNPFINKQSQEIIYKKIIIWMEICVMEDKLNRLIQFNQENNISAVIQEIKVDRIWNIYEYPFWLIFEVESQLQIRQKQFLIAYQMINNNGSIYQLNMGDGKTRIILPMYILFNVFRNFKESNKSENDILRLHFLNHLLGEAYTYLHLYLCASVFNIRPILMPFCREKNLTRATVSIIYRRLLYSRDNMGYFLVVAPEHRLSLQLKWYELSDSIQTSTSNNTETAYICSKLSDIYDLSYRNIFDECDELFNYKYQLIYSIGNCEALSSGPVRWKCLQAILYCLISNKQCDDILSKEGICTRKRTFTECSSESESFPEIRLLKGESLEKEWPSIVENIALSLIKNPPYYFVWLTGLDHTCTDKIIELITLPSADVSVIIDRLLNINDKLESRIDSLLALRGFLACGILKRCLQQRHRVNYGVARPHYKKKRVAVPFKSSDTPSNAEFSHQDIAITYTTLSYYYGRLVRQEVKDGFNYLLTKISPINRVKEYQLWFKLSERIMNINDANKINRVSKIDLSNETQFELLFNVYKENYEFINFWLNHILFPQETCQYPHKIVRNAWHLADSSNGLNLGFSGTIDNAILFPTQIVVGTVNEDEIAATDGKMLSLITNNPEVVVIGMSRISIDIEPPLWRQISNLCAIRRVSALIDVGAIMAGVECSKLVDYLVSVLVGNEKFKAVSYYDSKRSNWFVRCENNEWPKEQSPYLDKDTFLFFDEAHCRGADMKLASDAVALVTLGPKLCKDKLIQAAMRMRELDKGQKIFFVASKEIYDSVCNSNNIDKSKEVEINSMHILRWSIKNTIESNHDGLFQWAIQGHYFLMAKLFRSKVKQNESLSLKEYYGSPLTDQTVRKAVLQHMIKHGSLSNEFPIKYKSLRDDIQQRIKLYGSEYLISTNEVSDLECEREVEVEKEVEIEVEMELSQQQPIYESDWKFDILYSSESVDDVKTETNILTLQESIDNYVKFSALELSAIQWNISKCFCTRNFLETIQISDSTVNNNFNDYLRPVDYVILFRDGTLLLISEKEGNDILRMIWDNNIQKNRYINILVSNFSFLLDNIKFPKINNNRYNNNIFSSLFSNIRESSDFLLVETSLLQLFDGQTSYSQKRKEILKNLVLKSSLAKRQAIEIVDIRGKSIWLDKSDLEELCLLL